jgi:hypothetical protein
VTTAYKESGKIQWKNFIEVLSITDANAIENISKYQQVLDQFERLSPGSSSLSPHAPYSISEVSFNMINDAHKTKRSQFITRKQVQKMNSTRLVEASS